MGQACGKLSQTSQPVALLLHPRGFADPVGHQAHQTLGQFRHFLHEFRKHALSRKSQDAGIRERAPAYYANCFILEKAALR